MSCQRLVNAHVFNKEIHSGMRFPAPSKKENIGSRIRVGQTHFDGIRSPLMSSLYHNISTQLLKQ